MPEWKLNIFVGAIKVRIERENKTAADIIVDYTKLMEAEKVEILAAIAA